MYHNIVLFYFTGTRNELAATNWIVAVAKKQNIPVVVKKITPSLLVLWWLVFAVFPVFLIHLFSKPIPVIQEYFNLFFYLFLFITGLPIILFRYRILHFLLSFGFLMLCLLILRLQNINFGEGILHPKNICKLLVN